MFLVWTDGIIAIRSDDLFKRTGLQDGGLLIEYLKKLDAIEGIDAVVDTSKRTRFSLQTLPKEWIGLFVKETEAVIDRIKEWHSEQRET